MVEIIELPEEQFFLYIDGRECRVIVAVGDIKTIELPNGENDTLKLSTWEKSYTFKGKEAREVEEFLISKRKMFV
jgi:hypothetical protein